MYLKNKKNIPNSTYDITSTYNRNLKVPYFFPYARPRMVKKGEKSTTQVGYLHQRFGLPLMAFRLVNKFATV